MNEQTLASRSIQVAVVSVKPMRHVITQPCYHSCEVFATSSAAPLRNDAHRDAVYQVQSVIVM